MKTLPVIMSLLLGGTAAFAQFTNRSSVLDCSGTQASGGSFTNLSAAGQSGGIAVSGGGTYVNQAGFLNTFFMNSGLDTDCDGLADEADLDNDNDGLADAAELSGASFSPVTVTDLNEADSDGDGMSDHDESVAGTNPLDENALFLFRIRCNPMVNLTWVARSNKTYRVRYAATPMQPMTNVLSNVTVRGVAAAPWYVVTNTLTDASLAPSRVYAIDVLP
jgi:hypothetical protein